MQIRYKGNALDANLNRFEINSFPRDDRLNENAKEFGYTIGGGQHLSVVIKVIQNGYNVSFMGLSNQNGYEDPRIPPWAANWLTVIRSLL
jgi:hypothetical protein